MTARSSAWLAGILLACVPLLAHAQRVPGWLIAAVLSPFLVLLLCVVLGLVARSVRAWALHSGLVVLWVVLFSLAAYFVENDYVIWTPLVLYALHAAFVVFLIAVGVVRRMRRADV